jgi:cytochrome o ubiquinol oxidase operon protein cyoD
MKAEAPEIGTGSFWSYNLGLVLAVILTLVAFGCVMLRPFSVAVTGPIILVAALLQVGVHLTSFLHLNRSSTPRWNLAIFGFAVLLVAILISGSVWIMSDATHNMMPNMPQE